MDMLVSLLTRFFVLRRGACATASPSLRPPWPGVGVGGLRCWRLASSLALCCTDALRWTCVTAAASLMVSAGTTVDKHVLVAFVALQAPSGFTFWYNFREERDRWMWIIPFLGLLTRLLYITTGEWRRAISTTVLVGIAMVPSQVMNSRDSQGRAMLSSAIAVYLAFQHFTGTGSLTTHLWRCGLICHPVHRKHDSYQPDAGVLI